MGTGQESDMLHAYAVGWPAHTHTPPREASGCKATIFRPGGLQLKLKCPRAAGQLEALRQEKQKENYVGSETTPCIN